MRARDGRPLLLIDLAVPRDIDGACAAIDGVSLYDIDDLQAVVARNRKVRQAEARKAEGIIEEEIQHFAAWLGSLEVLPTLAALRAHAHARSPSRWSRENDGKWESASPRDLERVDAIARAVVNRLLHEPTLRMKELRDDRVHARMALVRELFGLDSRPRKPRAGSTGPGSGERRTSPRRAGRGPRACERRRRRPTPTMCGGTRGSALALAQARWVADRLGGEVELVTITDRGRPRRAVGDKSRWVSELERALLDGRDRPRRALGQGRAGRAAPTGSSWWRSPSARTPRDAICGAPSLRGRCRRARAWGRAACGEPRRSARSRDDLEVVPRARQRRHPAAQAGRGRVRRAGAGAGRAGAARREDAAAGSSTSWCPRRARGARARGAGRRDSRPGAVTRSPIPLAGGLRERRARARARTRGLVQHPARAPTPARPATAGSSSRPGSGCPTARRG